MPTLGYSIPDLPVAAADLFLSKLPPTHPPIPSFNRWLLLSVINHYF